MSFPIVKIIKSGATSKTLNIFIQNTNEAGVGLTGLVFNTAGLKIYYARDLAASVSITLVTQTVTGAWTTGGFVEIDATNMPGWYRLDVPNTAFATNSDQVVFSVSGASAYAAFGVDLDAEVALTGAVTFSSLTVTNGVVFNSGTAADAFLVTGAGSANGAHFVGSSNFGYALFLDQQGGNAAALHAVGNGTGPGGYFAGGASGGDGVDFVGTGAAGFGFYAQGGTNAAGGRFQGGSSAGSGLEAVATAGNSTGFLTVGIGTGDGIRCTRGVSGYDLNANFLQAGLSTAGTATSITLAAAASTVADYYTNAVITIVDGTGAGQSRVITGYTTGRVATVATWGTTTDNTSRYFISPTYNVLSGGSAPTVSQIATAVWQDTTAGDFTVASSIGKSLYTSGVVPGGSGGLFIAGTNHHLTVTNAVSFLGTFSITSGIFVFDGGIQVTNSSGDGISATSTAIQGNGMSLTGALATGGSTGGAGLVLQGGSATGSGSTASPGIIVSSGIGVGGGTIAASSAFLIQGTTTGGNAPGLVISSNVKAVDIQGTFNIAPTVTNADAFTITGKGSGSGVVITAGNAGVGATGFGVQITCPTGQPSLWIVNTATSPGGSAVEFGNNANTATMQINNSLGDALDISAGTVGDGLTIGSQGGGFVAFCVPDGSGNADGIAIAPGGTGKAINLYDSAFTAGQGILAGSFLLNNVFVTNGTVLDNFNAGGIGLAIQGGADATAPGVGLSITGGSTNGAGQTGGTALLVTGGSASGLGGIIGNDIECNGSGFILADLNGNVIGYGNGNGQSQMSFQGVGVEIGLRVQKNTALNNFEFLMVSSTDHITPKTGLTVTPTRSIDGGAFASCTNTVTAVGSGIYKINLSASDLNGNVITLQFTATGADAQYATIITQTD